MVPLLVGLNFSKAAKLFTKLLSVLWAFTFVAVAAVSLSLAAAPADAESLELEPLGVSRLVRTTRQNSPSVAKARVVTAYNRSCLQLFLGHARISRNRPGYANHLLLNGPPSTLRL